MDVDQELDVLIPGLPDDLALQCLARIPRGHLAHYSRVSRSWKRLIVEGYMELIHMRRNLGFFEEWPFVLLQGPRETGRVWRALDPVDLRWYTLAEYGADEAFHLGDKECFVAGRNLMVVGIQPRLSAAPDYRLETTQAIWNYDVDNLQWRLAPAMNVMRCLFASASTGPYGYVAGGSIIGQGRVANSAERFNSYTQIWEMLPDMAFQRRECSGFIMDDCFFVIGGLDTAGERHSHGEFFNPQTNSWTTVWHFWPVVERNMPGRPAAGAPPLVAVLNNELYALDAPANELKHYNRRTGAWTLITAVPGLAQHQTGGWGLAFKAVERELWIIGGSRMGVILAFTPDPVHGLHSPWRQVASTFNGDDDYCLNCAVMKM